MTPNLEPETSVERIQDMRKVLILATIGVFVSSSAFACGWGAKSADSAAGENQTVMTDQGESTQTTLPKASKPDSKG